MERDTAPRLSSRLASPKSLSRSRSVSPSSPKSGPGPQSTSLRSSKGIEACLVMVHGDHVEMLAGIQVWVKVFSQCCVCFPQAFPHITSSNMR